MDGILEQKLPSPYSPKYTLKTSLKKCNEVEIRNVGKSYSLFTESLQWNAKRRQGMRWFQEGLRGQDQRQEWWKRFEEIGYNQSKVFKAEKYTLKLIQTVETLCYGVLASLEVTVHWERPWTSDLPTSASYLQRLYTVQSSSGTKNKTQDFMIDKHSIN